MKLENESIGIKIERQEDGSYRAEINEGTESRVEIYDTAEEAIAARDAFKEKYPTKK